MPLVVCQDEFIRSLDAYLQSAGLGWEYHLYQNNVSPGVASVAGDFTECAFGGYSGGIAITAWQSPPTMSGLRATALGTPILVWTCDGSGAGNVYGFYVLDGSGNLVFAELNPTGPVSMNTNGQTYTVVPRYSRRSEYGT